MATDAIMMQTAKQKSDNINEANANILALLVVKADAEEHCKEVKDCLRAYKLNHQTKMLEAAFNKFNKDTLIKTLDFLNVTSDNIIKYKKQRIVTELICRIENLLLDQCGICGNQFATELNEKLLLQCKLCGQNAHLACLKTLLGESYHEELTSEDVLRLINPLKLDGLHYLCSSCSKSTIPSDDGKIEGSKSQEMGGNSKDKGEVVVTSQRQQTEGIDQSLKELDPSTHEEDDKPWRERNDLCNLFLQSKCPFGITGKKCNNFHPKVCNPYRKNGSHPKYGCRKGNACTFYHPDICPNSMKSHTCLNQECAYRWHLPRTVRVSNNRKRHSQITQYSDNYNRYSNRQINTRNFDRNSHKPYRHRHYSPKHNYNYNSHNNNIDVAYEYDISNDNDFPHLGCTQQRGDPSGGDNMLNKSRLQYNNGSCYNKNTGRFNNENFSLPFLAQHLQDSITQQVQRAFQHLNIPNQIQQELSKLQAHSNEDANRQMPHTNSPENPIAAYHKLLQNPGQMNQMLDSQEPLQATQPPPVLQNYYQPQHQGLLNQQQY